MLRTPFLALVATTALALAGCKIVYEDDSVVVIPDGPEGDLARNAARIEETFEAQLLPHIRDNALDISDLRAKVAADIAAAGAAHANQGSGRGAAWNFPVSGTGKVVEAKLDSRARTVSLDTDADGAADTVVQLGPVIKGTALRDAAPFYQFDDFRDQIEFAKLSRALNDKIKDGLTVPDGDPIGASVSFVGVIALKTAGDALIVTPIDVTFAP